MNAWIKLADGIVQVKVLGPKVLIAHRSESTQAHGYFRFANIVLGVIDSQSHDDSGRERDNGFAYDAIKIFSRKIEQDRAGLSVLFAIATKTTPYQFNYRFAGATCLSCFDPEILSAFNEQIPEISALAEQGVRLFQFKTESVQDSNLSWSVDYPLSLLSKEPEDLRIFADFQTKRDLEPTLAFWQPIQLYTTFSGYPWIRTYLSKVLELVKQPLLDASILIAPCGSGDFIRFMPTKLASSARKITGCDIRTDFLDLAKIRYHYEEIDHFNLLLCRHLYYVANGDSPSSLRFLKLCFQNLDDTNHFPTFIRMLAGLLDQALNHHAVPDWYLPTKFYLAGQGCSRALLAVNLSQCLKSNIDNIRRILLAAEKTELADEIKEIRQNYASGIFPHKVDLKRKDLLETEGIPSGHFDLVLSWEFIHVARKPGQLRKFLLGVVRQLNNSGTIILSSIREKEKRFPAEHEYAKTFLKEQGFTIQEELLTPESKNLPFYKQLSCNYPVLIASRDL